MIPQSRVEAVLAGSKIYFTGKPCKFGHICLRKTFRAVCVECRKLTAKKYKYPRKWAEADNIRRNNQYKASEALQFAAKQRATRRQRVKTSQTDFNDPITADRIVSQLERQHGLCAYCSADVRGAYTLDHIIPLARDGLHAMRNINLACKSCNDSKGIKLYPTEWMGR